MVGEAPHAGEAHAGEAHAGDRGVWAHACQGYAYRYGPTCEAGAR